MSTEEEAYSKGESMGYKIAKMFNGKVEILQIGLMDSAGVAQAYCNDANDLTTTSTVIYFPVEVIAMSSVPKQESVLQ